MSLIQEEKQDFIRDILKALQPQFASINSRFDNLEGSQEKMQNSIGTLEKSQIKLQSSIDALEESRNLMHKIQKELLDKQEHLQVYIQRNFDKIVYSEERWKPLRYDFDLLEKRQLLLEERVRRYERSTIYKE